MINFDGDLKSKVSILELLDRVLREKGDFGVYANLSGGLEALLENMNVHISVNEKHYAFDVSPKNTSGGHDVSFVIDRETEDLSGLVVGEVLPQPDLDT